MKKIIFILILASLIFLAGCANVQPKNEDLKNKDEICPAVCVPMYKFENNLCNYIECGSGCGSNNLDTFSTLQECQSKIIKEEILEIKEFTIEGDDLGLYPQEITVNKGEKIKITFKVRNEKVYYNGLDFRSKVFNTGTILPGKEKTIEFTATETFEYISYWPASGVEKETGKIIVM